MTNLTIALIGVVVLLVLLIMGMNIGVCMMAVGFFGVWYVRGLNPALTLFRNIPSPRLRPTPLRSYRYLS